jgi:hypothetical protein
LGQAKVYLKLGSKITTDSTRYRILATSTALSGSIKFYAKASAGVAKTSVPFAGNSQRGQIGDRMLPFVVQVSDTGDNGVPNQIVQFTIIQRPGVAKLDTLTNYFATTNDSGLASTILTLGNRSGIYKVMASIAGLKDTTFEAEAIKVIADVNNDNYLNIGDLTSIIDHITGRRVLPKSSYAFLKADMYPFINDTTIGDGNVDFDDALVCVDSLISGSWTPTRDQTAIPEIPLAKGAGIKIPGGSGSSIGISATDSVNIQLTHIGSRFSINNTVPVKGLQAVIYLKNKAQVDTTDVVFDRAKMMRAEVKSSGKEVTVILWNKNNDPIKPGNDPIFRLPIVLDSNAIDSVNVLFSTGDDNSVSMMNMKRSDIRNQIPREWMLYQNYPNPFNPSTTIEFDVPEVSGRVPRVAIQIFNILGQKVRTIEKGIFDVGRYPVIWDGMSDNGIRVASGVYFYRLLAGDYASTKKMVMLK